MTRFVEGVKSNANLLTQIVALATGNIAQVFTTIGPPWPNASRGAMYTAFATVTVWLVCYFVFQQIRIDAFWRTISFITVVCLLVTVFWKYAGLHHEMTYVDEAGNVRARSSQWSETVIQAIEMPEVKPQPGIKNFQGLLHKGMTEVEVREIVGDDLMYDAESRRTIESELFQLWMLLVGSTSALVGISGAMDSGSINDSSDNSPSE